MTDETPVASPCSRSAAYYRKNAERLRESVRIYRLKNREILLSRRRELYLKNREKLREQARSFYRCHCEKIRARGREFYRRSPPRRNITEAQKASARERVRKYRAKHKERLQAEERKRLATDPAYKFTRILRSRVGKAVKEQYAGKAFKTMDVIGCGVHELLAHLEKQFLPGMGWNNFGREGWHIDHIIPCAAFDLSKAEQQKKCFHFSNLRPTWARHNQAKASRIEGELPLIYLHKKVAQPR